jgi:hypothetical protein
MGANLKARFPDLRFEEFKSLEALTDAIATGRVYASVATFEHAAEFRQKGIGRFRIIGTLGQPYPISVAVRSDDPMLLSLLQRAVETITLVERDRLSQRQTAFTIEEKLDLAWLWEVLGGVLAIARFLGYRHYEPTRLNRRLRADKGAAEVANRASQSVPIAEPRRSSDSTPSRTPLRSC